MEQKTDWKVYWESVVRCVTKANGETEIHHENGEVEYFNGYGRRIKKK
jgi:hypothetical protein